MEEKNRIEAVDLNPDGTLKASKVYFSPICPWNETSSYNCNEDKR